MLRLNESSRHVVMQRITITISIYYYYYHGATTAIICYCYCNNVIKNYPFSLVYARKVL